MTKYYSVWVYNWIPDIQSGLSAIEIWFRSRFDTVSETISNCHVWGCPTYILESKLQKTGTQIPNWAPRSRRGVNMGFSKMHSTQVGLVLNLLTGSISTQYFVVLDAIFYNVLSSTALSIFLDMRLYY